jgi:ABC-2 type transport system permease protein
MMGAARLLFGMELGSVANLAVVVAVFLLIPIAVGVAVAAFTQTVVSADSIFGVWTNIMPIIGGLLVPVFLLPGVPEGVARISPYYWSLRATQEVTIRGGTLADVWLELLVIAGFAGALLAIALPRFSYRMRGA